MMKLLATVAVAALALSSPVFAQNSTQMISGPGVTCAPSTASTASTSTDTTASTGAATSSTMALGADNQVNAQTARTGLSNSQTNVDKLSSFAATVVCVVDLDTLAQSDATLKDDITKYRSNNGQIKPALEGNTTIMDVIKAQHPSFDINHVVGTDIGPSGELVLYVSRS